MVAVQDSSEMKGHIVAALIGVAGSIVVAWFTTQASFKQELSAKEAELVQIRQEVQEMKDEMEKLNKQIDLAKKTASTVFNVGKKMIPFGKKKDDDQDSETKE